jgi:signal peptidase I
VIFIVLVFCGGALAAEDACDLRPVMIEGNSLSPLIQDGESVLMSPAACVQEIMRGDLVVFRTGAQSMPVIKQVKALPGDRFALKDRHIFVNGHELMNSGGASYTLDARHSAILSLYEDDYGGIIPHDTYLVLGENPAGALDSSRIGLVHKDDIVMVGSLFMDIRPDYTKISPAGKVR